jgi:lipopolysaccharide/colanic/teichoic acid biosynthesis glycosyltransferase
VNRLYRKFGKRALDLVICAPALVLLSPLMALVALVIWLRLGRPVLFTQQRPGRHARPFVCCKFRTMRDTRDVQGNLLPDAQRMEPVTSFLRNASLDELPQLWNVIRGDMSLVGPRPLVMRYLPRYSTQQFRRHEVLPGVTGWAQVNGRNDISWEAKFKLDVEYVDGLSLGFDLKILWLTLVKVVSREGVNASGYATAPEFEGSGQPKAREAEPANDPAAAHGMHSTR